MKFGASLDCRISRDVNIQTEYFTVLFWFGFVIRRFVRMDFLFFIDPSASPVFGCTSLELMMFEKV